METNLGEGALVSTEVLVAAPCELLFSTLTSRMALASPASGGGAPAAAVAKVLVAAAAGGLTSEEGRVGVGPPSGLMLELPLFPLLLLFLALLAAEAARGLG